MREEILTKKELSELLKVSERTIDKLRQEGMPCYKIGTVVRFDKAEVLAWLKEKQN